MGAYERAVILRNWLNSIEYVLSPMVVSLHRTSDYRLKVTDRDGVVFFIDVYLGEEDAARTDQPETPREKR